MKGAQPFSIKTAGKGISSKPLLIVMSVSSLRSRPPVFRPRDVSGIAAVAIAGAIAWTASTANFCADATFSDLSSPEGAARRSDKHQQLTVTDP